MSSNRNKKDVWYADSRNPAAQALKRQRNIVQDKAAAEKQMTAEQLIADSYELNRSIENRSDKATLVLASPEELKAHRASKRLEFDKLIRRDMMILTNWIRFARWEERQGDMTRARDIFEKAITHHVGDVRVWREYAELEVRHQHVSHARNVLERAIQQLPMESSLWIQYILIEQAASGSPKKNRETGRMTIYRGVKAARDLFNRWMVFKPSVEAWLAFVTFEEAASLEEFLEDDSDGNDDEQRQRQMQDAQNECVHRTRDVWRRFVVEHNTADTWRCYIAWEVKKHSRDSLQLSSSCSHNTPQISQRPAEVALTALESIPKIAPGRMALVADAAKAFQIVNDVEKARSVLEEEGLQTVLDNRAARKKIAATQSKKSQQSAPLLITASNRVSGSGQQTVSSAPIDGKRARDDDDEEMSIPRSRQVGSTEDEDEFETIEIAASEAGPLFATYCRFEAAHGEPARANQLAISSQKAVHQAAINADPSCATVTDRLSLIAILQHTITEERRKIKVSTEAAQRQNTASNTKHKKRGNLLESICAIADEIATDTKSHRSTQASDVERSEQMIAQCQRRIENLYCTGPLGSAETMEPRGDVEWTRASHFAVSHARYWEQCRGDRLRAAETLYTALGLVVAAEEAMEGGVQVAPPPPPMPWLSLALGDLFIRAAAADVTEKNEFLPMFRKTILGAIAQYEGEISLYRRLIQVEKSLHNHSDVQKAYRLLCLSPLGKDSALWIEWAEWENTVAEHGGQTPQQRSEKVLTEALERPDTNGKDVLWARLIKHRVSYGNKQGARQLYEEMLEEALAVVIKTLKSSGVDSHAADPTQAPRKSSSQELEIPINRLLYIYTLFERFCRSCYAVDEANDALRAMWKTTGKALKKLGGTTAMIDNRAVAAVFDAWRVFERAHGTAETLKAIDSVADAPESKRSKLWQLVENAK